MGERGLRLSQICIARGEAILLELDLHIAPGEVLTVMGPSGAGKSTLLSLIIGTLRRDFNAAGRVLLDGRDITDLPTAKRRVGILFQDDLLFPHLSVGENLAFGLSADVKGRAIRRARVETALDEIGLTGFADRDPATLSGGQKARVALMRMLLSEPCALLLDEAFSRLDTARRDQIRALVFDYASRRGLPTLMVTHDMADARAAGGKVIQI
ncbi:ATP-binding cassette domain-containing protein [Actibacterium sp. 188UL27-1]|uniref:ATP-binding cassette domain-containing protein n=1 Tax=Actibacterium sp. 188UL27-1 TaxID=2786961 RepID=UPI00195D67A0|nr:ATP-binding cassette domain-containing protein [Actibacterium sp. 188UL27-1]MBM7066356.1 ATP-binding cassette domain-containing protein [Actibacterium sp. 188UL27-1]